MSWRPVMPISFTAMPCSGSEEVLCVCVFHRPILCFLVFATLSHVLIPLPLPRQPQQCSQIVVTLLCSSTINTVCFTILILMTCSCVLSRIWHLEWLFCMWWATQWNNISIFRGWPHDGPHLSPTLCWDRRQLSLMNLLYFHMQVVTGCWYAFFHLCNGWDPPLAILV